MSMGLRGTDIDDHISGRDVRRLSPLSRQLMINRFLDVMSLPMKRCNQ